MVCFGRHSLYYGSMSLTLIAGPIKSGKSLELIARVEPLTYTKQKVLFVQPKINVRDKQITSRSGLKKHALKVDTLTEITEPFDVIAIDEIHMFDNRALKVIKSWLAADKAIYISGLDLDYRGKLMPVFKGLLELKPDEIIIKKAVCELCQQFDARYTQILQDGVLITSGESHIIPEDGRYLYRAVCRSCFAKRT